MNRQIFLMFCIMLSSLFCYGDDLSTGEFAFLLDGSPAMTGQATNDHLFVRGDYNDNGGLLAYDNVVSFKSGAIQTVWLWLDDDEIYLNDKVQALTPTLIANNAEPYNEITYNSAQFNIYLPESIEMIEIENEDGDMVSFEQGDRMPNSAEFLFSEKETKVIDGLTYRVYTVVISNSNNNGTHFSSRNARMYRENGALKKDDAPLVGIYLRNNNQNEDEGQLNDMIIANQMFCFREAFTTDPLWTPNDYSFVFGEGGNNETQRFQYYNRVTLYGSEGIESDVLASYISLNITNIEINEGESFQLTASVQPSNTTNKTVTWTSSNPAVASVNSNGVVTALAPGIATITATTTDGSNLSASCTVTVKEVIVLATSISLNQTNAELMKGDSMSLSATVLPSNATNKEVTWTSSNTDVAFVDSDGLVTAISPGTVTITATTTDGSNLSASCVVVVTPKIVLATSILLNHTSAEMAEGGRLSLSATVLPNNATNKTVTWTSSDPAVAVVNSIGETTGVVTAMSPGTVTITATTTDGSNLSATCRVTVIENIEYVIHIDDTEALAGSTVTIPVQLHNEGILSGFMMDFYYPEGFMVKGHSKTDRLTDGSSLGGSNYVEDHYYRLVCTNTSTNIVVEAGDGPIFNINVQIPEGATGAYDISMRGINLAFEVGGGFFADKHATLTVNEVVTATSINLNQTTARVTKGETIQLSATVMPENATNKDVNWSSSDPAVASVDANGLVSALEVGTATITATTTDGSNLSASCELTITENLINYDNYLSMEDVEAFRGDTIVIPVVMFNSSSIISFQTDIFLPEGIELLQEDGDYLIDPSDRMTRTHSLVSNDVANGAIRVLCYSSNYKPFTGNSGDDLFYMTVKVAGDAEGDYAIQLKNTLLTTSDFEELVAPDCSGNVHVKSYLPGDANGSGTVTVTDVVVTSQYILEQNPHPFIFEAADVNADGTITVTDVSRIAWMVLNPTLSAPMRSSTLWNNGDCMSGEEVTLLPGETRKVSIVLDNEMDYTAFQLDLNMPEGLSASNFALTDRAGSHAFDVSLLADGNTRALCYSPVLKGISGHEGALLTFDVTAMGLVQGDITVDGIELVTTACETVKLDGFTIGVNNSSAVTETASGKIVARVDYFNLAGQRVTEPVDGVTLIVTTYTDGTRIATKVYR